MDEQGKYVKVRALRAFDQRNPHFTVWRTAGEEFPTDWQTAACLVRAGLVERAEEPATA